MTRMESALEILKTAREQAYVTALMQKESGATVVGTIGAVDTALLWAAGLRPLPLMSRDASQSQFAPAACESFCEPLRATTGYAATDRCPLIHAAEIIFVNDSCPLRKRLPEIWSDRKVVTVPGALSEQAPVLEAAVGRPSWDVLRAVRRVDAKRRSLIASLTDCLKTRRLSLEEWRWAVGEHPFLEDPETQVEVLAEVWQATQARPLDPPETVLNLGQSYLFGADPTVLRELDERNVGWRLVSYGCEEEEGARMAVHVSVPQKGCRKEPTGTCEERREIGMANCLL